MLNCKEATQRIEQMNFENVGVFKKITLKLHLAMCDACKKYKLDSDSIDRMIKKSTSKSEELYSKEELTALKEKVI